MPRKRLFAGLSLANPDTGEVPVPKGPNFEFTTGVAQDIVDATQKKRALPKRASGTSPVAKPSFRPESRRAPFALDVRVNEKTDETLTSSFRRLDYVGVAKSSEPAEFGPLTRAEGANRLPHSAEHAIERKSFPRMDRATNQPRVRTDPGTPMRDGRTSATARVERVNKTGTRKRRAAGKARPRSADKPVFSGKVGMTASPRLTREAVIVRAEREAAQAYKALHADAFLTELRASSSRANAKKALTDAMGRERDALASGDTATADAARAEIRALRKSLKKGA